VLRLCRHFLCPGEAEIDFSRECDSLVVDVTTSAPQFLQELTSSSEVERRDFTSHRLGFALPAVVEPKSPGAMPALGSGRAQLLQSARLVLKGGIGTRDARTARLGKEREMKPFLVIAAVAALALPGCNCGGTTPQPFEGPCTVGAQRCSTDERSANGSLVLEHCITLTDFNNKPIGTMWTDQPCFVIGTPGPVPSKCGGYSCEPLTDGGSDFYCFC
jgi:hypothetical protein